MTHYAIAITAKEKAELLSIDSPGPLGPRDVRGKTVATLVSQGTELAWNYLGKQPDSTHAFPNFPGYASVFRADEIGSEVKDLVAGTLLLCMGGHRSFQQQDILNVIPVPSGLPPREAVLARLMGVTMTTLMTTAARPGDIVLVCGAGPIGYLGAHLFANSGYDVRVVEPDPKRRETIQKSGIRIVYPSIPSEDGSLKGKVALVVECSGHEQSVLDGTRIVRKGGEVVLVGVPWHKRTDISAHELISAVFHQYAVIRSGWEWELPNHVSDFRPHSIFSGYQLALRWLAEKRIPLHGLISLCDPADAQSVYQGLLRGTSESLFHVFDWEKSVTRNSGGSI
jgi:threonine dehydrogenase-like Zn-dependent dehydrogenase